jgi:hypothetical protein
VADDWMTNVFGLTAIHPGSSTGGVLDRTKIGKQEGTCETQLSHPASQKLSPVQLLPKAQLQRILFISSNKQNKKTGRQLIRRFKKREIT